MKIPYTRKTTLIPDINPIKKGDWVDLYVAKDYDIKKDTYQAVSLGITMKLPKGFEAWVLPRSSTGKIYNVLTYNSMGIIDESYCGPDDVWHILLYATEDTRVHTGDRICQFRIMPKMQAGILAKLRWLFMGKVKFVEVEYMLTKNRGGLGSTGRR